MGKIAFAPGKLEIHHLRGRLVPLVWATETVTRQHPGAAARAAVIERYGMDRVIRGCADLYAMLAGG